MGKKNKKVTTHNVVVITSLFPVPESPKRGIFVYNMLRSFGGKASFTIVVPTPRLFFSRKNKSSDWAKFKEKLHSKLPNVNAIYYVSYLFLPRIFHPFFSCLLYYKLKKLLNCLVRERDYDLIHSHFLFPEGIISARLGKDFSIKTICTVYGSDLNIIADRIYWRSFFKYALKNLSGLVFVSQTLYKKFLSGVGKKSRSSGPKLSVIPNGFADWAIPRGYPEDESLIAKLRSQGKIILYVGNLVKVKRVDVLMEAFSHTRVAECRVTLIIRGDGTQKPKIRAKAKVLNLVEGETIFFLDEIEYERVLFLMQQADVLVLTSENEGLPGVVLESLNLGTPVVATAVGGVPEVVLDGVNGFLCRKNDPKDIASHLLKALSHPWQYEEIKASVNDYTWTSIGEQLSTYYTEIVEG